MDDMYEQHETPTGDASATVGHYLTGTLAAADTAVRLLTWLKRRQGADELDLPPDALRPGDLQQAGRLLDPDGAAYDAMLGDDRGRTADSDTALLAWVSAQPYREADPRAELVAGRAEDRLRDLHPDAMNRYDALRSGLSPVEAMREVAPLIVAEQAGEQAREVFAPMLDSATAGTADSTQALAAWSAALPLADSVPDAATAAAAAENRLRDLHPDAMSRYDDLRATHTPATAIAEVGTLLDHPTSTVPAGTAVTSAGSPGVDQLRPPAERYSTAVHQALGAEFAGKVLHDDAWPALAGSLAKAEQLGAQPADLLRTAAGERELTSAKSVAEVLTFRVEQRQPDRTPTAADLVSTSYPTALTAANAPGRSSGPQDLAMLGAALELGREADAERRTATASETVTDDASTPHVDERQEGLAKAAPHNDRAAADQATSTALLHQADRAAVVDAHPPATAAQSYPTPVGQVSTAQSTAAATRAAPAAAAAVRTSRPSPQAAARRR